MAGNTVTQIGFGFKVAIGFALFGLVMMLVLGLMNKAG
jgi:hypothetical protein